MTRAGVIRERTSADDDTATKHEETMDVGSMMIFASHGWDGMTDRQVWDEDIALARQAPGLGFDVLWSAERAAIWGTPDRVLRELEERRRLIGDFELNASFRFGGIPYVKAERSLSLFGKEVLPALKTWQPAVIAHAAD
jgi:hypothetical protein